ncbi:MAG: hypothetical protein COB02_05120 [Candidatus Cloacimonadota bacterium]|nr:MAG: hypothetical protein COB02_05120 [Candidatus Cloacimonadota bacterium]
MYKLLSYVLLNLLLSASIFAMFCPDCGTKNKEKFKYCYSCGEKLPSSLNFKQDEKKTEHSSHLYDYKKNLVYPGKVKSKNEKLIDSLRNKIKKNNKLRGTYKTKRAKSSNPAGIFSFMQGGAAKQLMGLQGKTISNNQLLELNESPQVNQLMNQMKSQSFQKNLLEGLKQMKGSKGSSNKKMDSSINQLEALFQMLNMQGAMNLDQP